MRVLLCVLVCAAAAVGCSDHDYRPLVATQEGLVRGVARRSAAGAVFYSFRGVRYARPPVGALRFRPPQRHPGWTGVADAIDHGSRCLQLDFFSGFARDGGEDCLFANVHTPRLPAPGGGAVGRLPVMVYIHGGGFILGNGDDVTYGPGYLMDAAVVLVSFNYRLGPLGFFTTHDRHAPGNYGLLDQVLLLQWLRDNVAHFGGDPGAVTIFGESAGAASVSLLVLSPLAKGLFHHAISQSGGSMTNFAANGRRQGSAEKFARRLNCSSADTAAMVECVRWVSAETLSDVERDVGEGWIHFLPRVDGEADAPLLPADPRTILQSGSFNLVPWLHGVTEEEGTFFLPPIRESWSNLTQLGIVADLTTESESRILDCGADPEEELRKIYDFYIAANAIYDGSLLPFARIISDRKFNAPIFEEMRLASAHVPVYKYVLDHTGAGRQTFADLFGVALPDFGATHQDDLIYLFNTDKQPIPPTHTPAYTMIRFMVDVWTTFARTGRPSSNVLPMPDWPIFTESSQRHMRLNSQPSVGTHAFEERMRFWQTVRVNEPWRHVLQTCCEIPC